MSRKRVISLCLWQRHILAQKRSWIKRYSCASFSQAVGLQLWPFIPTLTPMSVLHVINPKLRFTKLFYKFFFMCVDSVELNDYLKIFKAQSSVQMIRNKINPPSCIERNVETLLNINHPNALNLKHLAFTFK